MFSPVPEFPEGGVIASFLLRGFPTGWSHNELKVIWYTLGQETFSHNVVSFLLYLLVFCWRGKMTNTSSILLYPSIFIGNEMEDRNARFSIKSKGQYSRIAFCMNLAQLFIRSYITRLWNMFPFKNTCALFCFSSTIDENTDTVLFFKLGFTPRKAEQTWGYTKKKHKNVKAYRKSPQKEMSVNS